MSELAPYESLINALAMLIATVLTILAKEAITEWTRHRRKKHPEEFESD